MYVPLLSSLVPKTKTDMRSKLRGLQYGQKENATERP